MKKLFCLIAISAVFAVGCQNSAKTDDKAIQHLNDREMKYLKDYVLHNMLQDHRLTADQRQMIEETEPVVKITYEDDKTGKAYISWSIPQTLKHAATIKEFPESIVPYKTINIRGYGDLSDPHGIPWSVSLVDQGDVVVIRPSTQDLNNK
jgi:hypothetical protein